MFKYLSGESHAWKESKENLALGTSTKSLASVENLKRERKEGKRCLCFGYLGVCRRLQPISDKLFDASKVYNIPHARRARAKDIPLVKWCVCVV